MLPRRIRTRRPRAPSCCELPSLSVFWSPSHHRVLGFLSLVSSSRSSVLVPSYVVLYPTVPPSICPVLVLYPYMPPVVRLTISLDIPHLAIVFSWSEEVNVRWMSQTSSSVRIAQIECRSQVRAPGLGPKQVLILYPAHIATLLFCTLNIEAPGQRGVIIVPPVDH